MGWELMFSGEEPLGLADWGRVDDFCSTGVARGAAGSAGGGP